MSLARLTHIRAWFDRHRHDYDPGLNAPPQVWSGYFAELLAEARVPHEPPAVMPSIREHVKRMYEAGASTPEVREWLIQSLEAQEARPAPPLDWQPIATAPKDADMLLLYSERDGLRSGFWYESLSPEAPDGWCCVETQGLTGGRMEPTHWAIPDPPAAVPQADQE